MRRGPRTVMSGLGVLALVGLLAACDGASAPSPTPVSAADVTWPSARFAAVVPDGAFLDDAYANGFGTPVPFEGSLCGVTADGAVLVTLLADDDPNTPTGGAGYDVASGQRLWLRDTLECDESVSGERLLGDVVYGADRATDTLEVVDVRTGASTTVALHPPETPHPMTVDRVVRLADGSALVTWWQPDEAAGGPEHWYDVVDPHTGAVGWRPPHGDDCGAGEPTRAVVVCTSGDGAGVSVFDAATGRALASSDSGGPVTVLADGFVVGGALYDLEGTRLGESAERSAVLPDGAVWRTADLPSNASVRAVDGSGRAVVVSARVEGADTLVVRRGDGFVRLPGDGQLQAVTRDGKGLLLVGSDGGSSEIVFELVTDGERAATARVPLHRGLFGHAEVGGLVVVITGNPDDQGPRGTTFVVPPER